MAGAATETVRAGTMEKVEWIFRDLINPYFGNRPIDEVIPLELLASSDVSMHAANTKRLIAPNSVANRSCVMPSLLVARYAIRHRTSVARWPGLSQRITQPSPSPVE